MKICRYKSMNDSRRGQGALAFSFIVGVTAILAALALALFTTRFTSLVFSFHSANRAFAAASAGAEDALLRLIRNKEFEAASYVVPLDTSISASVSVEQDVPVAGQVRIFSESGVFRNKRKIQVIASVDDITGEVRVVEWKQVVF